MLTAVFKRSADGYLIVRYTQPLLFICFHRDFASIFLFSASRAFST